ncbi:hypothetical protein KIF53_15175 [Chromobacterium subtsugae]|uniref:Uncharacterized protein n=1 Tax=Chromobacterium subtsugae TaxID=251747 RepID=A0ABS7FFY4_9NEIS|nr:MULTISPECIES: hypothetical protein [Chromobacterium]MBW7567748.1 hypothetical protein [Chromobacterium subtsugae]MBW8288974.1 hypothetical protein [Chromobacterium subtsugae]WSE91233.1 hypothetical protein U6115_20515 [Chromobacterium subtsugae]WVH59608.1 hypothetical protein U6151_20545 [Chromobacterium subtsugae]
MINKITSYLITIATFSASTMSMAADFSQGEFYSLVAQSKNTVGKSSSSFIRKIKENCKADSGKDSYLSQKNYQNIYHCTINNEDYTLGFNEEGNNKKITSNYFGLLAPSNKYLVLLKSIQKTSGKGYALDSTKSTTKRVGWTKPLNSDNNISIEIGSLVAENKLFLQSYLEDSGAP